MTHNLAARDLQCLWHPCSQMKDYESFPPLEIQKAFGSYLYLTDGKPIIDAISSWWCKSLGHGHPRLKHALLQQLDRFEHILLANTTHEVIVELSEKLTHFADHLTKVFYASDGSSAIEIALKMSLHARRIESSDREHLIALENGYHGETCLALSVSDLGLYKTPYQPFLQDVRFIKNLPYVAGPEDPLWHDCSSVWPAIEAQLAHWSEDSTALIFEPLVQGAGGMKIYSPDFLKRLCAWANKHRIHCISDEIMVGLGRLGAPLISTHFGLKPDFVCLSKGLTAGWLPMSAVLTTDAIYNLFYHSDVAKRAFLHSHTHSGNALAAAVALETLKILKEENWYLEVRQLETSLRQGMQQVAADTAALKNVRACGGIVAADLVALPHERLGFKVFQQAVQKGAWLRPLGNTIYWLPPFNVSSSTLEELIEITTQVIFNTMDC